MDSSHKATDAALRFAGVKLAPWSSFIFWGSVVLASTFPWLRGALVHLQRLFLFSREPGRVEWWMELPWQPVQCPSLITFSLLY